MAISSIDKKQQTQIAMSGLGLTFIGVMVAVLAHLQNKKHAQINEETANINKEIKLLELALKKGEAKAKGVI